jgi:1,4-alpha-glucan branching enzyme
MAEPLGNYVSEMGFTHVEFLPLKEHPYGPSWGYQVSYYYAPSARYGTPDDFRYLIDYLHQRGVGVIMDWVPAHFPKDAWALGRFDGSALYEHLDPRLGEHPDWGTYIFNYGRNEVRNFLIANALYWLKEFHIDGLRVDAVASMLYLDYSRKEGEWVPNAHGGRENLEALAFLKELNETTHRACAGALMIAEESTALTFGLLYAWSENFILPLSHDEVVHMKGSLLNKLPGSAEQKFAQLRALYGYMWAHPGKKLLFMGGEFGQWREWTETESLDWHLLDDRFHSGVQRFVRDLNRVYEANNSLWESDGDPDVFEWLDVDNALENVVAFMRKSPKTGKRIICVGNFSAVARSQYRLVLPEAGEYKLVINSDADVYAGSGRVSIDTVSSEAVAHHGREYSASVDLPALSTMWFDVPS